MSCLVTGATRFFRYAMAAASVSAIVLAVPAPPAHADGLVRYEVISNYVSAVSVDFTDGAGRTSIPGVALPWRANVAVADPYSVDTTLRVTWPGAQRYKWVKIRIYTRGSLLCEGIFDTGEGSCTAKGLYGGQIPPFLVPVEPPGNPG